MSPSDADAIRIGNRYRLDERIGAGAMGAVWRGTDELLNRTVAIKELLAVAAPPGVDVEESRQRILREGRIGARLQHPHVISMFDVVVHDDRPWLVMEYLPSRSLAAVLHEKGRMSPREAAAVGQQVADGLAAAHAAGVVHRDVKPGNVLISEDGRAKITDFGVSRAVDDVQLTRTGMIAGTPAFLAPEVARGQQPTSASDVFALGATLYAAVEGEPPFGLDDNAYALLHQVATGNVRPPVGAGPLTALLTRLLNDDPARRPTASQARDALAAVAAGAFVPGSEEGTRVLAGAGNVAAAAPRSVPRTLAELEVPAVAFNGPPPFSEGRPTVGPPEPPRPRRRLPVLLLALLVMLVVGVGVVIGVVRTSSNSGQISAAPVPAAPSPTPTPPPTPSTTSVAPTTTASPTTTSAPSSSRSTATTTTAATTTAARAAQGDAVAFVQRYYGLLPGNVDAAFALLSPTAQEESGGIEGYRSFYAQLSAVAVESAQAVGGNTVQATIVFTRRDGTITREPYRFVVGTGSDGTMVLQSFSRV